MKLATDQNNLPMFCFNLSTDKS